MASGEDTANIQPELKALVQKRGQIKSALTRFKKYVESVGGGNSLSQLELRLNNLKDTWAEFNSVQSHIELIDSSDAQENERGLIEDQYFELSAKALDYIKEFKLTPQPNTVPSNVNNSTPSTSAPQIRLPSLHLPTFSGKVEEWIPFSDSFKSLITSNDSLDTIQKLHYLKSSLKGEALNVISSLEVTASNYQIAWDLLENRYKNTRVIVHRHVRALFELPSVDSREPVTSLRQLMDSALMHIRALDALDQPTKHWDTLLIHLVTSKLSPSICKEWELSTVPDELPKFKQLSDFIQRRCQIMENSTRDRNTSKLSSSSPAVRPPTKTCLVTQSDGCRFCKGSHAIYKCPAIKETPWPERSKRIKSAGLCFNCLRPGHTVTQCRSSGCRLCARKHHTLLHHDDKLRHQLPTSEVTNPKKYPEEEVVVTHAVIGKEDSSHVILSTALVEIVSPHGRSTMCRALIDNGSQSCFMTEGLVQRLHLKKYSHSVQISGIDQCPVSANKVTYATVKSRISNFRAPLSFVVVPTITGHLPAHECRIDHLNIPSHIALADPSFNKPGPVDILLGQEIFWDLLCIGQIRSAGLPTLQKTRLGWIVGGRLVGDQHVSNNRKELFCNLATAEVVDQQLQRFWHLEETPKVKHLTSEELTCEDHFKTHTRRDPDGRYVVKMPLISDASDLGDSREMAMRRFMHLERKLQRSPDIQEQYKAFMAEYLELGHMEVVNNERQLCEPEYFLPHHPVMKISSSTTKLRVVFDASARTTSGKSLNEIQMVGPTVQSDLVSIILRSRTHNFVMTADLEKMYRQVRINSSQRNLLQIFWRNDPQQPLKEYRLTTVTYGTSSAAYLATRVLKQLASDEGASYPEAAKVTDRDFYVDDVMTGTPTLEEGIELQGQLINLLSKGGFNLRKWNANSDALLDNLPPELRERKAVELLKNDDASVKTLGLWWDAERDEFLFKHSADYVGSHKRLTKRVVLSEIARIFDPLGLLAPIIIRAKIQMQELWKIKIDWDESLPLYQETKWLQFLQCLQDLNHLRIPRQTTLREPSGTYELHGFSDASQQAYGGAVYLRHSNNDSIKVSLMCAKSRVAPLKSVSLPRLELCAALLTAELVSAVRATLNLTIDNTIYWTDSTVVIAWIKSEPARWTTFVANRVAKIQEIASSEWRHVSTHENPSDLLSRGTRASSLADSQLWWNGPTWLSSSVSQWPKSEVISNTHEHLPETRPSKISSLLITQADPQPSSALRDIINKYSSFNKLKRVLAYCLRFIQNSRAAKEDRILGALTPDEIEKATKKIIAHVQEQEFSEELKILTGKSGSRVAKLKSSISSLTPFIDSEGMIRVGGRIDESDLSYESKHQLLLPKAHRVTEMIAQEEHSRNMHCGPQALLYAIRQNFWPVSGRQLTRRIVHQCIRCFKARPREANQLMGNLPSTRLRPTRAFLHTGVDYCGPFLTKQSRRRNSQSNKSYVAVFVCLATKALHLELVSDATTDAFLAALRRFISRRGICAKILSDNGKNFVGANRQLRELRDLFEAESSRIIYEAAAEGIQWTFNPPYSPHMGGVWEAAVKSLKYHLHRIVGSASLTFEELSTIITQVEAVLNSRPLTPMSNNPTDLSVLTPAHFLIGNSLKAIPEPSLTLMQEGRLSRWQRLQQLLQHFWARWSSEYLNNLQQRRKWTSPSQQLTAGSLVLLKEDNTPPLTWPMGRIVRLHEGKDGLTRVVTVKTANAEVRRNVNKLCPLPIQTEIEEQH